MWLPEQCYLQVRRSETKIRGVLSPGMLCSEKELGLGDDASGILVLDESCKPGVSLTKAFPFVKDAILQTGVTPNRGDCLSILGTAREVAALTGKPWKVPEIPVGKESVSVEKRIQVEVPDANLCPRYVVTMVEGVNIGPSPLEIRLKLTRAGYAPFPMLWMPPTLFSSNAANLSTRSTIICWKNGGSWFAAATRVRHSSLWTVRKGDFPRTLLRSEMAEDLWL